MPCVRDGEHNWKVDTFVNGGMVIVSGHFCTRCGLRTAKTRPPARSSQPANLAAKRKSVREHRHGWSELTNGTGRNCGCGVTEIYSAEVLRLRDRARNRAAARVPGVPVSPGRFDKLSAGAKLRRALLLRDGPYCCLCDLEMTLWDPPTLEHVVPRSAGGGYTMANLKLSHARCNHERGTTPL